MRTWTNRRGVTFGFVEISEDAYKFTLVKNPEMKSRYGRLEITNQSSGLDKITIIDCIKNWDEFGKANEVDPSMIVDESAPYVGSGKYTGYTPHWKHARFKGNTCTTVGYSLISLLESFGFKITTTYILKLNDVHF